MECSTTELRQHATDAGIGPEAPARCAVPCHKAMGRASEERLRGHQKRPKISAGRPRPASAAPITGRSGSHFVTARLQRLDLAEHDLEFDHFACFVEFGQADELKLPFADFGGKFQRGVMGACDKAAHRSILRPCSYGSAASSDGSTMKDEKDKHAGPAAKHPKPDSRQDRLKLALRENLKRRKSQARGRSDPAPASSNGDEAAPHDDSGNKPGG